jgi:hypothetical protein
MAAISSLAPDDGVPPEATDAAYALLLFRAQERWPIYYDQLAQRIRYAYELDLSQSHGRAMLGRILWNVALRSEATFGCMLPALAVSKSTNRPSGRTEPGNLSGFFGAAEQLGRDVSNPDTLVLNEQLRAYKAVTGRGAS